MHLFLCGSDFKELSKRRRNTTPQLQLDELCTLAETLNNWTVVDRVGDVCVVYLALYADGITQIIVPG